MSELTLTVIRLGFLAVLWAFVLTLAGVMRTDLFGQRVSRSSAQGQPRGPKPPRPPKPAKSATPKPPKAPEVTSLRVIYEKESAPETAKNIEIIFDASNSMWGQIAGEAKITIARKVLTQIINGLPDSLNVGLRDQAGHVRCMVEQQHRPVAHGPIVHHHLIGTGMFIGERRQLGVRIELAHLDVNVALNLL